MKTLGSSSVGVGGGAGDGLPIFPATELFDIDTSNSAFFDAAVFGDNNVLVMSHDASSNPIFKIIDSDGNTIVSDTQLKVFVGCSVSCCTLSDGNVFMVVSKFGVGAYYYVIDSSGSFVVTETNFGIGTDNFVERVFFTSLSDGNTAIQYLLTVADQLKIRIINTAGTQVGSEVLLQSSITLNRGGIASHNNGTFTTFYWNGSNTMHSLRNNDGTVNGTDYILTTATAFPTHTGATTLTNSKVAVISREAASPFEAIIFVFDTDGSLLVDGLIIDTLRADSQGILGLSDDRILVSVSRDSLHIDYKIMDDTGATLQDWELIINERANSFTVCDLFSDGSTAIVYAAPLIPGRRFYIKIATN